MQNIIVRATLHKDNVAMTRITKRDMLMDNLINWKNIF